MVVGDETWSFVCGCEEWDERKDLAMLLNEVV